ncbi:acetyltransferase [Niastella caeni]|uniref:Acetyltransferase n=1 Tax=Niastella caeni TaxID=2569763 RepID=A0A4S8H9H7_9BACT|nr:acetyltransferase [Niastella caeni]THU30791.1 acetyltransferase [Niastella caeni]
MMISYVQLESHMEVEISIKPFVIPDDIRYIRQWTGVDEAGLMPFYESIAASSFIHAVMVWDKDQPLFEAAICEAVFDDLGLGHAVQPGDYTLRLQIAPNAGHDAILQGLNNCIDYLFSNKAASRILVPVHTTNKIFMEWGREDKYTKKMDKKVIYIQKRASLQFG